MHEYELLFELDQAFYSYRYQSPIPLSSGLVIENIGGDDQPYPVFIVESVTIDLTGSVEIMIGFHPQSNEEEIEKARSFVLKNWKRLS